MKCVGLELSEDDGLAEIPGGQSSAELNLRGFVYLRARCRRRRDYWPGKHDPEHQVENIPTAGIHMRG